MKNILSSAIILVATILSLSSCSRNFDINKEGGVRIVVEIQTEDIVKALSNNSQDTTFRQAFELAEERKHNSESDFITLFGEAFEEIAPDARLAPIFLYELKDIGITIHSSNDDVLRTLKEEINAAVNRASQIIATRLYRYSEEKSSLFHRFKYNLKWTENPNRIQIEFASDVANDSQMYRLRRLLQGAGQLEFWETSDFANIEPYLTAVDSVLALDSYENESHPLFEILHIEKAKDACIGCAALCDIDDVTQMLNKNKELANCPRNIKFAWTASPRTIIIDSDDTKVYDLIALKMSRDNSCALGGEVITDALPDFGQGNQAEVAIQMNPEGVHIWKRFTGDNIGRQIAIVLDDYVLSYPVVNSEIPNGKATIQYEDMTSEEAQDLANILKAGKLPAPARIVEEALVEPNKGQ